MNTLDTTRIAESVGIKKAPVMLTWAGLHRFAEAVAAEAVAADATQREAEWQPIETAPLENGKHVLLFGDGSGFAQCVFVGRWDSVLGRWLPFIGTGSVRPTYWMPLPKSPNAK